MQEEQSSEWRGRLTVAPETVRERVNPEGVCFCLCFLLSPKPLEIFFGPTATTRSVKEQNFNRVSLNLSNWIGYIWCVCTCTCMYINAVLGLHCSMQAFSGCRAQGLEYLASVFVAHGLSCPTVCGDLPGPGIEPLFPALEGGFLTTGPPGKSLDF